MPIYDPKSKIVECPYCNGNRINCDYCDDSGLMHESEIEWYRNIDDDEDE